MEFDYSNIDGALTPEQALQALSLGEGDTGAQPDNGGAPATTPATDDKGAAGGDETAKSNADAAAAASDPKDANTPADAEDPAKAVVLARDGKHTIPYETLVKHREGEQHWKAQAEAAQQALAELQAQAQARADAGEAATKTDTMAAQAQAAINAGADANLFGDFSEEALAKGIQTLVDLKVAEQVGARVAEALKPLQAKQQQDAAAAHYEAIYGKHPDADSIAQSSEFKAWVDAQPSAVRSAYWGLFDHKTGGTAEQIVEVFDAFKAATTPKTNTTAAADTKAAASAAIAAARSEAPASLSSIPGGHAGGATALDRTADMSGPEMLSATQGMTPEQIEAWLNRTV
ncbi:hypothetical protein [Alicycliphilus denitrificans]|uniref:hypothetical protein n=1 Tax=Alicycliphilus denitrificans TaxID=179636 RepID=UPI0021557B58|nr:hypothetical protein [Alicycliphilus denitrificans]